MWILTLALILGSAVSAYVFMVLILQSAAHEMQKKKLPDSWQRSLSKTLHVGGTYTLTTREKGKFGRYLGVIMLSDKTSINAALVSEHLAVPYYGQSKQAIEDAHAANYEILEEKGLV
jgi:endonuclease YncB( thermonuclease family)